MFQACRPMGRLLHFWFASSRRRFSEAQATLLSGLESGYGRRPWSVPDDRKGEDGYGRRAEPPSVSGSRERGAAVAG